MCRFDGLSGGMPDGTPRTEVPPEVLDSIRKNGVSLECFLVLGLLVAPFVMHSSWWGSWYVLGVCIAWTDSDKTLEMLESIRKNGLSP
jgi:hypothetical protein